MEPVPGAEVSLPWLRSGCRTGRSECVQFLASLRVPTSKIFTEPAASGTASCSAGAQHDSGPCSDGPADPATLPGAPKGVSNPGAQPPPFRALCCHPREGGGFSLPAHRRLPGHFLEFTAKGCLCAVSGGPAQGVGLPEGLWAPAGEAPGVRAAPRPPAPGVAGTASQEPPARTTCIIRTLLSEPDK